MISNYPYADLDELVDFGKLVKQAADKRNHAAHPGIVEIDKATEDKKVVFANETFVMTEKFRDLLIRLLNILGILPVNQA